MSDHPKPPPLPAQPLRLVKTRHAQHEKLLRAENERLRADLEAERALVEVLRNQPRTAESRSLEDTLPGVGAPGRYQPTPARVKLAKRRRGRGKWVALAGAVIGLATGLASLRYPGLVSQFEQIAKTLLEALQ